MKDPSGYQEFRKMVDEHKRLGRRRRKLFEFIANNPGATPYRIARAVYGDPMVYHRTVVKMLEMIRRRVPGLLHEETEGKVKHISLTDRGLEAPSIAGSLGAEDDLENFLSVLDPIVKRSPDLVTLKEKTTWNHQAYLAMKLLKEVIPIALERLFKLIKEWAP